MIHSVQFQRLTCPQMRPKYNQAIIEAVMPPGPREHGIVELTPAAARAVTLLCG